MNNCEENIKHARNIKALFWCGCIKKPMAKMRNWFERNEEPIVASVVVSVLVAIGFVCGYAQRQRSAFERAYSAGYAAGVKDGAFWAVGVVEARRSGKPAMSASERESLRRGAVGLRKMVELAREGK